MKYSYECCVCITYHVTALSHRSWTSIVFHCFQGRPHHLAQLTSLWRHDFFPDKQSAIDRRSIFRNLFRPLINETVFYGVFRVVLRFVLLEHCDIVLLEQTKLLDAEFKYLTIFSIWVKLTLLNWNKNNSSLINTINMREKYSKDSGFTWFWYPSGGMAVYSMAAYERVLYSLTSMWYHFHTCIC